MDCRPARPLLAIACCTYRRPTQFRDCLRSLCMQEAGDVELALLALDNDPLKSGRDTFGAAAREFAGSARYIPVEPTGAAFARNAALEAAEEIGADWLVFIDDDQVAPPEWAQEAVAAIRRHAADLCFAPTRYLCRHGAYAEILSSFSTHSGDDGLSVSSGGTGNLIMRRKVFAKDGLGLRFDTRLSLIGGEDLDFTRRAHRLGAILKRTSSPAVAEIIPPERATLRYVASRSFYSVRLEQLLGAHNPKLARRSSRLKYAALRLVRGTFRAAPALLMLRLWKGARRELFRAVIDLSQAAGLVSTALFPLRMADIDKIEMKKKG